MSIFKQFTFLSETDTENPYHPDFTEPHTFFDIALFLYHVIIFCVISIVLGFLVDDIIEEPEIETPSISLFMIIAQVLLDVLIIYCMKYLYEHYTGLHVNYFLGLTTFAILFFIVQKQLFNRMRNIYINISGKDF